MFFITEEPHDDIYHKLVDLAFDICDTFILVVYPRFKLYEGIEWVANKS
jgi:hypothetical protein